MFQTLLSKVVSGVISLSMMLLSSYEGNNADFSELVSLIFRNNIVFKTQLIDAFENDFESVFKSGKQIDIYFDIQIQIQGREPFSETFIHSILFDPLKQYYSIYLQEKDEELKTDNIKELKKLISKVEYNYSGRRSKEMIISITSYLPKIKLDDSGKNYDLMMLWNFKKPKTKKTVLIKEDEF